MEVLFRQAWQQKHPSPSHAGGDFHWHPGELLGAAQAIASAGARAETEGGVAVVSIGPRHVLWLRGFVAVAAAEQRRYVGWSGCAAEPVGGDPAAWAEVLPAVLGRLALPPARPFEIGEIGETGETGETGEAGAADGAASAARQSIEAAPPLGDPGAELAAAGDAEGLARALFLGGAVAVAAPLDPGLPALWGRLASWLPPGERVRPREATLRTRVAPAPLAEPARNLFHYLARCWEQRARRTWRLVEDLGAAERQSLPELFEELTRVATAWERPSDLLGYLQAAGILSAEELAAGDQAAPAPLLVPEIEDAGRLWNRLLHYWGRGFLWPGTRGAAEPLGRVLARRIVVDHLIALDASRAAPPDPERYLRRLRFESLLPLARVRALRSGIGRLLPSLEVSPERA